MKLVLRNYLLLLISIGIIAFPTNFIAALENKKPIIETKTFPNGSSIEVTLPEGFSGNVVTSCYNGVCTSTSTPVTQNDIDLLKAEIEDHKKEMEDFFRQVQMVFDQMIAYRWIWNW